MLQSHSIDISNGLQLIQKILNFIEEARGSDEIIDEWFEKAKSIRSEIHFEPTAIDNFATQSRPNRVQRVPEMDDFSEDDKQRFKHSFVFLILDVASSKLEERFQHFEELSSAFAFLFDLHSKEISLEQCRQLEKKFTSEKDGKKDVDADQLFDEIKSFQVLVDDDMKKSPLGFLNKIQSLNLASIYPNLVIALRLFLTLPVTVAAAESSFSKLKLLKNYLRTTMTHDRLTHLASWQPFRSNPNCWTRFRNRLLLKNSQQQKLEKLFFKLNETGCRTMIVIILIISEILDHCFNLLMKIK